MNLREKLKRLDKENYSSLKQEKKINNCGKKLTDLVRGKIISCENGQYFHRKIKFKSDFKHGLYPVKELSCFNQEEICNLTGKNNGNVAVNCNNMLFMDTETTSLMGGTGTVAFLIGIGYFTAGNFIVEQYFMRDFNEETAMLNDLLDKLRKPVLVSFNGKSFDLPLLKTRLILNRIPAVSYDLHLDLLHLSRRIWSHLNSCRLSNLEEKILQIKRKDDIPGSEIPGIYFSYLENKDPVNLPPIFKHNMIDIVSLVTLTTHLLKVHNLAHSLQLSTAELFNLGKLLQKRKKLTASIDILEKAREKTDSSVLRRKIDIKLSWQYKRADRWLEAVAIWKDMLSRQSGGLFPYRELAKYYEHREKTLQKQKGIAKRVCYTSGITNPLLKTAKMSRINLNTVWNDSKERLKVNYHYLLLI